MRTFAMILLAFWIAAPQANASIPRQAPKKSGKIVITVDITRHALWVEKTTKHGHLNLGGWTLPMVRESLHPGTYRPSKMYTRYRTVGGNVYLENVIFFDGAHAIRTSRLFKELQKGGRPVTAQVTLEPDFGMIVYQTVNDFGKDNTTIIIR